MHWRTVIRAGVTACAALVLVLGASDGQTPPSFPSVPPADANQYVRQIVLHTVEADAQDHTLWRYRFHREDEKNNYDREVVETREGELARTLLIDGQPLNSEQRQKDEERMRRLVTSQEERDQRAKRLRDDGEKAEQMFRAIPDAFEFKYDGMEDGLVRFSFYPKANYDPPTRDLKVFRSMSGNMWIDSAQHRLARIDGRLFEDVTFGWGFLARLNKGGTFRVTQREVAPHHWEVVGLDVNMTGHAVLFKNISFRQHEVKSEFHSVPESLTLNQAYAILEKVGPVSANNQSSPGAAQSKRAE